MPIITKSFATVLKEQRLNAQLSQEKLAEKADLSTRYISLLECEDQNPSLNTVISIAHALNLLPSTLLQYMEHTQNTIQ
jgi:transcriptional regulator with XRE-family HTH domain